jgi:glycosyltransferase involved in cell wall biosynthesis
MTILFISNDPSIFDSTSVARSRMRAYAHEIGTLHILSAGRSQEYVREELPEGGVLVLHALMTPKPFLFFAMLKKAKKLLRTEPIELVSAQDPFEYGYIALCATRGTKARLHIQVHTDPFSPWFIRASDASFSSLRMPLQNRARVWLADRVIPRAQGLRVVSQRIGTALLKRYPHCKAESIALIPISVLVLVPTVVPLPPNSFSFSFITVGRLESEKRIQDILAALARIHAEHPSVGLFVVGEGSKRRMLEKRARKLGLSNHVQFLRNRPDAIGLMQSAHGYVQASAYEGYSRTLLEAALARVPIITTDVGIVGEVFRNGEEALVTAPGDPTALAQNQPKREALVVAAEKAARIHLSTVHTTPADIAADLRTVLANAQKTTSV